jgi:hypothetical protein
MTEIAQTFRWQPDKNLDNKEKAERWFKLAAEAYSCPFLPGLAASNPDSICQYSNFALVNILQRNTKAV